MVVGQIVRVFLSQGPLAEEKRTDQTQCSSEGEGSGGPAVVGDVEAPEEFAVDFVEEGAEEAEEEDLAEADAAHDC